MVARPKGNLRGPPVGEVSTNRLAISAASGRCIHFVDERKQRSLQADPILRAPDLLSPVTSAGPDQQQPHTADDSGAEDQAVAGPSGVSRPITRSITRATPPDDEDSD
ncbi:hypothetical protein SRHO_G00021160 [Serrasalmus rhombeus]